MKMDDGKPESLPYRLIVRRLDLERPTLEELSVELSNMTHDAEGTMIYSIRAMFPHAGHLIVLLEKL
jgi:hypothetical protein